MQFKVTERFQVCKATSVKANPYVFCTFYRLYCINQEHPSGSQ